MADTDIPLINPQRGAQYNYFDRSIDKNPPGGGSGGATGGSWPMKLVKVDDENVKVTYGTVNGAVPTNIETNIDVSGTNSTWAIYLRAILNPDGSIVVTDVTADNTNTVPADDSSNAYLRVGAVVVAAAVITTVYPSLAWSQTFVTCGRDPDDPSTTPGTYYWVVA